MLATVNQVARHNLVAENLRVGVNVFEELIERCNALCEATLNAVPLGRGDKARHQIIGEDALRTLVAPIDGKRDALGEKRQVG